MKTDDRGPLDLERQIEDLEKMYDLLKKDNLYLAKEIDRLNEYVQEMELENVGRKEKTKR
jgi:hypothetical protein|tara:strand:- start:179 stop:358 length:180 start_codon:yes stop_codon:yes gene_type:complete